MKETEKQKKIRLIIIILTIVGLVSFLSQTVTVFAYGIDNTTDFYLLLYPILFVSLILVLAKSKFGILLTLLTSISYSILLTNEVGKYLTFDFQNSILILVLLLPYLIFLSLIPLSIVYLTDKTENRKKFQLTSILFALGFFAFIIFDRMDKDYSRTVFLDAVLKNNGIVELKLKPGFADSREFYVNTNSKELEKIIKEKGEFVQGSYFLSNTRIQTNYKFNKLQSLTIIEFNKNIELPKLTWNVDEINGNYDFIRP
ncbi:hypothetical protein [uncultured Winogradskyella sp.]|uniref:hypothetical protein n=1 Tax=uncultured Winogradskyella sp. TaxID=395353 RepID=UPI002617BA9F|nr:hypothetical protein [uncultured Winogradskyella sp.]